MIAGPLLPRASMLSTTPPSRASGCWSTNALRAAQARLLGVGQHQHHVVAQPRRRRSAPGPSPGSSTCRRRRRWRPARSAPSRSARPGRPGRWSAVPGISRDHVADPGQADAAGAGRQLAALHRDGVLHLRASGRARAACRRRCSRTRSLAALPATCGSAAIAWTCSNARAALNSPAGASAPRAAGGRTDHSAATPDRDQRDQRHQGGDGPRAGGGSGRGRRRSRMGDI